MYVGEDVCKLGAVFGDLEDVELCLSNEVWDVSGCVGDVAWLVEPGGSVLRQAQDRFLRLRRPFDGAQDRTSLRMSGVLLSRWLRRTECVVELLLESCGGSRRFSGGRFAKRPYVMVIVTRGLFRLWPVLGDFAEASIVEDLVALSRS